jgi:ribose transport system substrate-binding protein
MLKKLLCASAVVSVAALAGPSFAADKPTIPIIVKDTTSAYWQIVFAGARAAAKDLNVNVPELGAQSESDINGEISILENAVAEKPAAVVIAPTEFKALGKPIDEAAKKVPIIGVDSAADSKAFTSFLTTDNVQGGRIAADGMAAAIAAKYGKAEGDVALITHLPGVGSLEARNKGYKEELAAKYPGLKLVADKVSDGNATTGLNIMTDLITANPNLRGVFADNLIQCQGASQAVAENKKGDTIKLVCFDADDKTDRLPQGRLDRRSVAAGPVSHGLRRHQDGPRRLQGREGRSLRRHRRQPGHQGQHGRRERARPAVPEGEVIV